MRTGIPPTHRHKLCAFANGQYEQLFSGYKRPRHHFKTIPCYDSNPIFQPPDLPTPHMKFLVHAPFASQPMQERLGAKDYSYIFLLRAFTRALESLGDVVRIEEPSEAEEIHAESAAYGVGCILLSFAPPYETPILQHCPVVPVFAWEYPDIPECRDEEICWQDDPRHDWRYPLSLAGRAIALTEHTVSAVKRSLGKSYPIAAIPSPLNNLPGAWEPRPGPLAPEEGVLLDLEASVVDSWQLGLNADGLDVRGEDDGTPCYPQDEELLPFPPGHEEYTEVPTNEWQRPELASDEQVVPACGWEIPPVTHIRTRLHGAVYTSVLTPASGRKNWKDLISAFCWAFRDTEDATLVLKVSGKELWRMHNEMLMLLTKMSPMKCRVIAIHDYISGEAYRNLVGLTTYYVNASLSEGLCLPLLEFLGRGVPAIAPDNTAMADYIDEELAFVVASYPNDPTVWPHGDWNLNRTTFNQIDWESLFHAYKASYQLVRQDRVGYDRMSRNANRKIHAYCSPDVVSERLHEFLCPDLPLHKEIREDPQPADAHP